MTMHFKSHKMTYKKVMSLNEMNIWIIKFAYTFYQQMKG